jgi:hypothetical protein
MPLLNYGDPSIGIKIFKGTVQRDYSPFLTYMDRPRPDFQKFRKILKPEAVLIEA